MKSLKSLLFIAAFVLVSLVGPSAARVHAESGTGDTDLDSMISKLTEAASTLNDKGYTVVNLTIDKGLKGEKYLTTRNLYAGNDYTIMGVGGNGVADLDISLLDKDGNVVDKDSLQDSTPIVKTSVSKDNQYYFQTVISALDKNESEDDAFFYGYVIGFKNQKPADTTPTLPQGTSS